MSESPLPPPPPAPDLPMPGFKVKRLPTNLDKIKEYGLSDKEFAALQLYTTSLYDPLNKYLRGYASARDREAMATFVANSALYVDTFDQYVELVVSGMNKLPEYMDTKEVQRGLNLAPTHYNPAGLLEAYDDFSVVVDAGFMSTTFDAPFAKDTIVVLELPEGHPGRDLAWLSKFEQEKEVLFPPGTSFVTTRHCEPGDPEFDEVLARLVKDEEDRANRFGVVKRIVYGTILNWQTNPAYEPLSGPPDPAYVPKHSFVLDATGGLSDSDGAGMRLFVDAVGERLVEQGMDTSSTTVVVALEDGTWKAGVYVADRDDAAAVITADQASPESVVYYGSDPQGLDPQTDSDYPQFDGSQDDVSGSVDLIDQNLRDSADRYSFVLDGTGTWGDDDGASVRLFANAVADRLAEQDLDSTSTTTVITLDQNTWTAHVHGQDGGDPVVLTADHSTPDTLHS